MNTLRAAHLIVTALYLITATLLLGFGFIEAMLLIGVVAFASYLFLWLPLFARLHAASEFAEFSLGSRFDEQGGAGRGLTESVYTRPLRGARVRRRIRHAAALPQSTHRVLDIGLPASLFAAWLALAFTLTRLLGI